MYSYLSDFSGCYVQDIPIYVFVKFVVLIILIVQIFKLSLFEAVALMDSFRLSVEQFVFRRRLDLLKTALTLSSLIVFSFCFPAYSQ